MVLRALEIITQASTVILVKTVASGGAATKGQAGKFGATDDEATNVTATTDDAFCIFLDSGGPGDKVRCALPGNGVAKVKVGSGDASAGAPAKYVADGLSDATAGGGTTKQVIFGQFLQSGVAGEFFGLNLGAFGFSVGA